MTAPHAALELQNIYLRAAQHVLFEDFSLRLERDEIVTLMGPSGCGKSTLLAYLCGTLPASIQARGSVRLGSRELTALPPEQRRLGILFQDDLLFPHLSVADNLAFALSPRLRQRRERQARIEAALQDAELTGFGARDPATLSGGQRARIALLRTLLAEPEALLLDEPFAKLDSATKTRFRDFVFEHARARQLPTLLVTHDPADAIAAGGRVIEL
ncbi:MAG: ATP-binding cassette domain-containing protein [Candidatus Competibacteraceae bacterium]|nr:ATP-binding cassette domain-containing protein [Candidatus Competibacteraceae bacterium]MCB1811668.1 ATP-binding cassette domain-containing protein [Candidatus Competibacteraceae bacterium]